MLNGRIVKRSWGFYITLIDRQQFKVKLLRFKKNAALSVQYHKFRNELWLMLSGKHSGEWWNIAKREIHTYHTPVPTWVLEIQYGDVCEEGDIVRI